MILIYFRIRLKSNYESCQEFYLTILYYRYGMHFRTCYLRPLLGMIQIILMKIFVIGIVLPVLPLVRRVWQRSQNYTTKFR